MKRIFQLVVCSAIAAGLATSGCRKDKFNIASRDTTGLKPTPVDPGPPPDPTLVSFDNADADANWEIVGPKSVETTGKKEGTGYLKSAIVRNEDYMHFIKRRPATVNPNLTVENGQFVFWFYVSDPALLKSDGQIELTSSGESDKKEYSWNLAPMIPSLVAGWNEINLNFSTADRSGDGGPDITAFNFFRIYFWTKDKDHADLVVGVDDLRFRARAKTSLSFDNADADANWEIVGPKAVETTGKKEGTGYLKSSILNGEDYMHFIKRRTATLNSGFTKETGQLKFWFYVSNIAEIKLDGQIELTSSGESDKNEYSWNLDGLLPSIKDGWNEITLNFSDAAESSGGGPDLAALNFFRMYFWTKSKTHADVTVGIDDVRITEK